MNDLINKVVNTLVQVITALLLSKAHEAKQLQEMPQEDLIKKQLDLVLDEVLTQIPNSPEFVKRTVRYFVLLQAESIEKLCEQSVSQLLDQLNNVDKPAS